MANRIPALTAALKKTFTQQQPIRAGSLIVTLFGDCVAPRGSQVWLGSLIRVLEDLGINQRLVRTAVYRLVQDGILTNEAIGRRSFYSLTVDGKRQFDEATQRIYFERHPTWDGSWCLVLTGRVDAGLRTTLRKDLAWLGFGAFGADLMAHPSPVRSRLMRHLQAFGAAERAVVLDARLPDQHSDLGLQALVADAWDLASLETAYARYIETFHPFLQALDGDGTTAPADAFHIRTFMIHEYRKILLRDPALPDELLPPSWQGFAAYRLTQALYRHIVTAAETFIDGAFESRIGPLPPPIAAFHRRFGGLAAC